MGHSPDLKTIWAQGNRAIPVLLHRKGTGERLRLRLPYAADNHAWLRADQRDLVTWDKTGKYWELPRAWFDRLVDRVLYRYSRIYVVQAYREMEKCAPACLTAVGHECECSCMGANHGHQNDGSWHEVSETFAFRWSDRQLACRLLKRRPGVNPPFWVR